MPHTRVTVDTSRITDWDSFHSVFAEAFGFPAFYGRNLDAWIDCLTSLDAPEDGLTAIHAPTNGVVVLDLPHARDLAIRCPDIYAALVECAAFINYRRIELGEEPVLCLSFFQ
jgi:hypothetical protein